MSSAISRMAWYPNEFVGSSDGSPCLILKVIFLGIFPGAFVMDLHFPERLLCPAARFARLPLAEKSRTIRQIISAGKRFSGNSVRQVQGFDMQSLGLVYRQPVSPLFVESTRRAAVAESWQTPVLQKSARGNSSGLGGKSPQAYCLGFGTLVTLAFPSSSNFHSGTDSRISHFIGRRVPRRTSFAGPLPPFSGGAIRSHPSPGRRIPGWSRCNCRWVDRA